MASCYSWRKGVSSSVQAAWWQGPPGFQRSNINMGTHGVSQKSEEEFPWSSWNPTECCRVWCMKFRVHPFDGWNWRSTLIRIEGPDAPRKKRWAVQIFDPFPSLLVQIFVAAVMCKRCNSCLMMPNQVISSHASALTGWRVHCTRRGDAIVTWW